MSARESAHIEASVASGVDGETIHVYTSKEVDVGTYTSEISSWYVTGGQAKTSNYNLQSSDKQYRIVEAILTRPSITGTYVYNGKTQTVQLANYYEDTMGVSNGSRIDAGSQTVTISIDDTRNYKWDNDSKNNLELTFTIEKKIVQVEWTNLEFTYNEAEQGPTATVNSGVEGERIYVTTSKEINASDNPYTSTIVDWRVEGGQAKTTNYTLTDTSVEYMINRANIYPEVVNMTGYEYKVTPTLPTPSVIGNKGNGEETFYYSSSNRNSGGTNWSTVRDSSSIEPGAYWMYATVAQTQNYNAAVTPTVKFIVGRAPIITVSSDTVYKKSQTAVVTIYDPDKDLPNMDNDQYLRERDITVYYEWTQSQTTPTSYSKSITIPVAANTSSVTGEITKNTDTGIWYLHIKATADDMIGYETTVQINGTFYLDNTRPVINTEANNETTLIDKYDSCTIPLIITDIHAGLATSEFTEDDINVYVAGEASTAEKDLSFVSQTSGVYTYNLKLSNVQETGWIHLEIPEDSIADRAGNENVNAIISRDEINIFVDNVEPVISLNGPIKVKSITAGKKYVEETTKYINQEYEIEIPLVLVEVGTGIENNELSGNDVSILVDEYEIIPTNRTLNSLTEIIEEDPVTKIKTYKKEYSLTVKGISSNGYLTIKIVGGRCK